MGNSLYGPLDDRAGRRRLRRRTRRAIGFFTDTSRSASAARPARWPARSGTTSPTDGVRLLTGHVLRQHRRRSARAPGGTWRSSSSRCTRRPRTSTCPAWAAGGHHGAGCHGRGPGADAATGVRWLMSSDVCKHCTHAACLDVCPTGALFRTEFGTVRRAAGHLQRLRLLRPGLPVRRDRPAQGATAGRSSARCATTGSGTGQKPACARPAPPSPSSSGRSTSCASGPTRGSPSCTSRASTRPALRPRPRRRRRRRRRVLPAARRARGLRAAAGPGGAPPATCARCGGTPARGRARPWPAPGVAAFLRTPAVTPRTPRAAPRERLMVPPPEFQLLLRPADHQDADVEDARRPAVPLPRRRSPARPRCSPRARR